MTKKSILKSEKKQQMEAHSNVGGDADFVNTGAWETISSQIWRYGPGSILVGVYDGCEEFTEGGSIAEGETNCMKHYFNVSMNERVYRYSMVGGKVFDKYMDQVSKGRLCRVEFIGQEDCKGGSKRVNVWDVQVAAD